MVKRASFRSLSLSGFVGSNPTLCIFKMADYDVACRYNTYCGMYELYTNEERAEKCQIVMAVPWKDSGDMVQPEEARKFLKDIHRTFCNNCEIFKRNFLKKLGEDELEKAIEEEVERMLAE